MKLGSALILALLILAAGCSLTTSQRPGLLRYDLPSGKQITPQNVAKMEFPSGPPSLVLDYVTDIPVSDKAALRKEVDEVWTLFRKDVEAAKLTAAAIRARNTDGKGYGFVLTKNDDGSWTWYDDKE